MSVSDEDERYYASIDETHDGNWLAAGFNLMMVDLTSEEFLEDERLEFEADNEADETLKMEEEFLLMPQSLDQEEIEQMGQLLHIRHLRLASCVSRCMAEGGCPPLIRIRRLDEADRTDILDLKKQGNQAFEANNYKKAIEYYDEATSRFPDRMFVAPEHDMKELLIILSNIAECHLRLMEYADAGNIATDALLLDDNHDKSRIRRAKAELATGSVSMLIQAKYDLECVLERRDSSAAAMAIARELSAAVTARLNDEQKKFLDRKPKGNWSLFVRDVKSRCW